MIAASGEAASEMFDQAGDFAKSMFSGPEGLATVAEARAGGISEPKQQVGFKNLEGEVGLEAAKNMWGQMTPWDHALLWGGAGVGILGLINAMSGEGGIGSWIMGILGMLGAAIPLARHGVFGQGAKDLTQSLTDMGSQAFGAGQKALGLGGGAKAPQAAASPAGQSAPSLFSQMGGGALKLLNSTVGKEDANRILMAAISNFASDDQRQKLNTGSGVGGFGNLLKSYVGDLTGKTRSMFDKYGIDPAQQEQILSANAQLYEQQAQNKSQI